MEKTKEISQYINYRNKLQLRSLSVNRQHKVDKI